MAIQGIAEQTTRSEGPALVEKIMDFFSSVADLLDLYFTSPTRQNRLDEEFRARLPIHEKVSFDQGLYSMWRH